MTTLIPKYDQGSTGAVNRPFNQKLQEIVSVKDFGATGDGVTDDTNAINAAATAVGSQTLFFPVGNYIYNGTGITIGANTTIIGEGEGDTIITLGSTSYFVNSSVNINTFNVSSLTFTGGYGAFKFTATNVNVGQQKLFEKCNFLQYTVCAVEENFQDCPYWHFRDCQFYGANSTSTIGIALSTGADNSIIDGCSFLLNRIHIKSRNALITSSIINSSFVQFNAGDGTPRACVWMVPYSTQINSGDGCNINGCSFGNEFQQSTDYKIIYADEDSVGTSNGNKFPLLSTASTGYVECHTYFSNKVAGAGATGIPFIYSTTDNVNNIIVDNIQIAGTYPSYWIQFLNATTTYDYTQHNFYVGRIGSLIGVTSASIPISNNTLQKMVFDPNAQFEGDSTNIMNYPGVGVDRSGYSQILTTRIGSFSLNGGATKTSNVTAADGSTEAALFNLPTNSNISAYVASAGAISVGTPTWIQCDLKQGASTPATVVKLLILPDSGGTIMWQRYINVPAGWQTFKFPVFFRNAASNLSISFQPVSGQNVQIGRVRCYNSRNPVSIGVANLEQLNLSSLPTSSAGLSSGTVWNNGGVLNIV